MKTKTKFTSEFQELSAYGEKEIHCRTFGKVIIENDREVPLLVLGEIYDLDKSGAVRLDELPDQKKPVMMTFSILPELKYVHKKHRQGAADSNGGYSTLEDIYEYMGGLRFEPSDVVWFATLNEAREHLLSKELNDQISGMGALSGFVMDQYYNRMGETNWDRLNKIMTGK